MSLLDHLSHSALDFHSLCARATSSPSDYASDVSLIFGILQRPAQSIRRLFTEVNSVLRSLEETGARESIFNPFGSKLDFPFIYSLSAPPPCSLCLPILPKLKENTWIALLHGPNKTLPRTNRKWEDSEGSGKGDCRPTYHPIPLIISIHHVPLKLVLT